MAKKKKKTNKKTQAQEIVAMPEPAIQPAENNAIITGSKYVGSLSLKIKDKNNNIKVIKSSHNEGTINLSKLFAMLLSGYPEAMSYVPKFLDLQFSSDNGITWLSYLKREVALTAISYYLDSSLSPANWVFSSTAVISYSNLRDPVSPESPYGFRFALKTDNIMNAIIPRELAYFYNITAEELSNIEDGTQAIIEWKMQLIHTNIDTE